MHYSREDLLDKRFYSPEDTGYQCYEIEISRYHCCGTRLAGRETGANLRTLFIFTLLLKIYLLEETKKYVSLFAVTLLLKRAKFTKCYDVLLDHIIPPCRTV